MNKKALWAAALAAVLGPLAQPAAACATCLEVRGGLGAVHPRSLEVALAIRRELDAKRLEDIAPSKDHARRRCRDIHVGRTLAKRVSAADGFELLLIEDGSRYRIEALRPPPSTRCITGRAVLQALLQGDLEFETAVKLGWVAVDKVSAHTAPCGFCARRGVHPRWLQVAGSIRRDLESGRLARVARIGSLAKRTFLREEFDLLLVDDGSHHRIASAGQVRRRAPPIRWVTGRAVLQALLENKLDLETAVKCGLVVVERTSARSDRAVRQAAPRRGTGTSDAERGSATNERSGVAADSRKHGE